MNKFYKSKDIFKNRDGELFRLADDYDGKQGTLQKYSFLKETWSQHHKVSNNVLDEHYDKLEYPIERLLENEKRVSAGQPLLIPENSSTLLLSESSVCSDTGQEMLPCETPSSVDSLLDESMRLKKYMETVAALAKAKIKEQLDALRDDNHPLNIAIRKMSVQVDTLQKTVSIIKMQLGEEVKITVVTEGTKADAAVPVTFRQRILFMDEEMAVLGSDNKGLDCDDIHLFIEWLKEPEHRDIIVPEQKCVVVMKPRRMMKRYSTDWATNRKLNRWNFHSFIVIRNGENVSVVESDNLCIHDSAIPKSDAIETIRADYWKSERNKEDAIRDLGYRAMLLAYTIQGIDDRTGFFCPSSERLSVKDNKGINFVFDDENDTMLGTGITPFRDWMKEKSSSIRRGSRVIYIPGFSGGDTTRYYSYEYSKPCGPDAGIYHVKTMETDGRITFMYMPDRWPSDSKRAERWITSKTEVINFDEVTSEEIERYLKDRTQRMNYEALIPMLVEYKKLKLKEESEEKLFIDCIRRDKSLPCTPSDDAIRQAIEWWKTKVIEIRPLSLDDKKSYRMILGRLKKENTDTNKN